VTGRLTQPDPQQAPDLREGDAPRALAAFPDPDQLLFARGSGSGRLSPRNRLVAAKLQQAGLATLLLDLLTAEEETAERVGGRLRFDVQLLAGRLAAALDWLATERRTSGLHVGLFGASTGVGGLAGRARLEVVPGASNLFPEPGALERVAELTVAWFLAHLAGEIASEHATS
jgi:hypothetical protein